MNCIDLQVPQGSDESLVDKMNEKFAEHEHYEKARFGNICKSKAFKFIKFMFSYSFHLCCFQHFLWNILQILLSILVLDFLRKIATQFRGNWSTCCVNPT